MTDVSLTAGGRASAHVTGEEIAALATTLRGRTCQQGDPGFDEARTIWNAMIDRRPGVVVRCRGAADVMHAVDFARDHGMSIAVKGGGHNIAGNAVCDDGLMIDLSPMTSVRVEPDARLRGSSRA